MYVDMEVQMWNVGMVSKLIPSLFAWDCKCTSMPKSELVLSTGPRPDTRGSAVLCILHACEGLRPVRSR